MSASHAFRDGLRRVRRAPAVLLGLYLALTLITVPGFVLVRDTLAGALGASLAGQRMAEGFDLLWWHELREQAPDVATEVAPSVIGGAAVVRNLSDLVSLTPGTKASAITALAWLLVGTALSGGILDRYARQRPLHAYGFFGACGRLFPRLLRLNVAGLLLHAAVLWAYGLLAFPLHAALTRDLASERVAFAWAVALLAPAACLVALVLIVVDCARVRMVVEDRRSALFALAAGGRFARRSLRPVATLYAIWLAAAGLVMGLYMLLAPGATWSGAWLVVAVAIAQLYVLARVALKLVAYASLTSLFQAALAHADYVAYPAPVWPDAPAVETLGPIAAPSEGGTAAPDGRTPATRAH